MSPHAASRTVTVGLIQDTATDNLSATLARAIDRVREAAAQGARYAIRFQPTNALAFLTQPGPFVDQFAQAVEARLREHSVPMRATAQDALPLRLLAGANMPNHGPA